MNKSKCIIAICLALVIGLSVGILGDIIQDKAREDDIIDIMAQGGGVYVNVVAYKHSDSAEFLGNIEAYCNEIMHLIDGNDYYSSDTPHQIQDYFRYIHLLVLDIGHSSEQDGEMSREYLINIVYDLYYLKNNSDMLIEEGVDITKYNTLKEIADYHYEIFTSDEFQCSLDEIVVHLNGRFNNIDLWI